MYTRLGIHEDPRRTERSYCVAFCNHGFISRLALSRPTSKSHNASGSGTHARVRQSTQGLLGWTRVPPFFPPKSKMRGFVENQKQGVTEKERDFDETDRDGKEGG